MVLDSNWTTRSGNQGGQYSDGGWSSFMNNNNIGGRDDGSGTYREYSWTITFQTYGQQVFDTAVDDQGNLWINDVNQFSLGSYGGQTSLATPGYFAPGDYTIKVSTLNSGGGPWGVAVDWTGVIPPPAPVINSFTASPETQTSGTDGIPNYDTTLSWSVSNAVSLSLSSPADGTINVIGTTSKDITNLPQSSGSGATRTYTLTATNVAGVSVSEEITVTVYNDRTPSNSWTSLFTGLDPVKEYEKLMGTLAGIDMTIEVSCPDDAVFFASSENGDYANPQYFTNGQDLYVKTITKDFNNNVTGLAADATTGKVNNKTFSVTIGGLSAFDVTFQTRAPVIKETFDYDGQAGNYPFEDIDLITNSPTSTLVTQTLKMDNIEIDMPIATDDPNVQIKINDNDWQNIQEI